VGRIVNGGGHIAGIGAGRASDPDDVGAQIGEEPGRHLAERLAQVQDPCSGQRRRRREGGRGIVDHRRLLGKYWHGSFGRVTADHRHTRSAVLTIADRRRCTCCDSQRVESRQRRIG
jgi:hypothetical protein